MIILAFLSFFFIGQILSAEIALLPGELSRKYDFHPALKLQTVEAAEKRGVDAEVFDNEHVPSLCSEVQLVSKTRSFSIGFTAFLLERMLPYSLGSRSPPPFMLV